MIILRKCRVCGIEAHSTNELSIFKTCKTGKYGKDTICKLCATKQTKLIASKTPERQIYNTKVRVRNNKIKALTYLGSKCKCCGITYDGTNAVIFDFHHIKPDEKEMKPTKALTMSWDNLLKEIQKCELLCSNCHRIKHKQEDW